MKQVFTGNTVLRRVLCAVLVAVMVFAMIPATAPKANAMTAGGKLYLDLTGNSNWLSSNARFAAYFFGNGEKWVDMKDSNGDKIYVCDVPSGGYTKVIFCRMNGSASANTWNNKWNQTGDLVPGTNQNYFKIGTGWDTGTSGSWSSYTCSHSGHGTDGKCKYCESTDVHSYTNGSCSCGAVDPNFKPTYYLVGYINGADYGIEDDYKNLGQYKFVDGTVTASFTAKTDVMIKTDNDQWFMTMDYTTADSAVFYNTATTTASKKMNVPLNVELTFTLVENADGTLTLSYTTGACLHPSHNTDGECTSCGEPVGHTFSDATCTSPKTCSVCGKTEGNALGHSWSDATCTAPKTCSVCGATEGSALGHSYENGNCSRCGQADPNNKVAAYLAGVMNDWSTTSLPLYGSDGITGSVTIELSAGTYKFKIVHNGTWYGNSGSFTDTTTTTSSSGWDMSSSAGDCTLNATGGTYTFTFNNSTKKLVVTHKSSGGSGGTTDDTKLYVGTTFYDYRSDDELNNKSLSSRTWWDVCYDSWYIFRNFNKALSDYYSKNNVKIPIYMGHFQPDWGDYGYQFNDSGFSNIYGFEGWVAAGNNHSVSQDQKWFMSVNNSLMDIDPTNDEILGATKVNSAAWGIVSSTLVGNKLMAATTSGTVAHPLFDETFLSKKYNGSQPYANIYHDVQFPFSKSNIGGIEYWVFDSEKTTLKMNSDFTALTQVNNPGDGFKNRGSADELKSTTGFFPFNTGSETTANQYNYGFGMRLDIPFNLTSDGKIADKYGDKQDIIYEFSGDDDVWVFIDGVLVLDIGGSHGKVTGEINFATMTATVSNVKSSLGNTSPKDSDSSKAGYQTNFTLPTERAGEHTLTMFYMERGMWESNMSIRFNFIPKSSLWNPTTSFSVIKQWNVANNSAISSSVKVQLQRRLQGTTTWTAVEEKTLTSANQSSNNSWQYKWEDLPNFEGETLYEYRVVELDADGNVLSNGAQNGKTMVAYGDVAGSGAAGYTQIISNNEVANPVVVVIDFGLSVDVHVNTSGTLEGVGNTLKLPVGTKNYKDSNVVASIEGKHGVATVRNGLIRYTPNDMMMDSADNIGFCVNIGGGQYNYSTLTVIPAANIYYEDSFLSFNDAVGANNTYGKWGTDGTTDTNKTQAEDRPDFGNDYDADNVYGYDAAYSSFTMYSLGSARKVTVDAASGKPTTAPTAVFSFTGTGFDVVSLTDSDSGAIAVEVKDAKGKIVKSYIVNNYYGMVFNTTTQSWEIAEDNSGYVLYQVPVIKVFDLPYGTYDVTIKAAYLPNFDKDRVGHYTIWLDAIRIYDPALNDATSNDAYDKDGESNPHLTTVKKLLVNPNDFGGNLDGNKNIVNGVVYVEGKDKNVTMAEYAHQGPNNETYLMNGNGIGFKLRYFGTSQPNISLQIGAKLAVGSEATLKCDGKKLVTLKTATNMFYKLPAVTWTKVSNGIWESSAILLSCTAGQNDILSLTDLKVTGADAAYITNSAATSAPETAQLLAVVDMDVQNLAVLVLSASEDVTDPTEPETDPTEPETTVPATTAPEKDPDNAQTGDAFGQNLPVFAVAAFLSLLAFLFMAAYASRRTERD